MSEQSAESAVESIFTWWQEVMGKPRARMDLKRRKAILARLRDGYSLSDLCDAVAGCACSDFHMGKNDRYTKYNDIELIFRDAAHVDDFIERWETLNKQNEILVARKGKEPVSISQMSPEERAQASARIRELIRSIK